MSSDSTAKPIIHIAIDEKFIDTAYNIYEKAFPGKNHFLILIEEGQNEIKYLSEEEIYEFIDTSDNYLSIVESKIERAEVVVFHGITPEQAQIATAISKKNKSFIWTVFGYEVYSNPYLFEEGFFGSKTYKRFIYSFKNKVINILLPYYFQFLKGIKDPNKNRLQAFREMDYIGVLYEEEFEFFHRKIGLDDSTKQLKFSYYPLNVIIDEEQEQVYGNDILLGNSASFTNNHLEVFDLLKCINLEDRKLIAPLSYGNSEYADAIIKEGRSIFGKKFHPLTEFLPLDEYQQILQSCGIVIMNHYRKEAGGNILMTLYMGSKVYLSRRNILFHYLKRIGCYVYSIENDLKAGNPDALNLLDNRQIKYNRGILKKELSLDRICSELGKTIRPLLN